MNLYVNVGMSILNMHNLIFVKPLLKIGMFHLFKPYRNDPLVLVVKERILTILSVGLQTVINSLLAHQWFVDSYCLSAI